MDVDGRALDSCYAYSLESNSWEKLDIESEAPLPDLYGHSMSLYNVYQFFSFALLLILLSTKLIRIGFIE